MTASASPPPPVMVDASFAAKWVLPEEGSAEADQQLSRWTASGTEIVAPDFFAIEITNVLHQFVRGGKGTEAFARTSFDFVLTSVRLIQTTTDDARHALVLAQQYRLRATYDALYLALAERLGCELWTADRRLAVTVRPALPWVRLFAPPLSP